MLSELVSKNDYTLYAAVVGFIESGSTPLNPFYHVPCSDKTSTAYGKYQLVDMLFKQYVPGRVTKSPLEQEYVMHRFTLDNVDGLKNADEDVSMYTLYLCHWQGLRGALKCLKNGRWKPAQGYMIKTLEKVNDAMLELRLR